MIEKCKYYNNALSASSLMIDDLVPALVSYDGIATTRNDWGYLMDQEGSLYNYLQTHLLSKYPEIKGTVFLPISSQDYIPTDKGYSVSKRNTDDPEFLLFLDRISIRFEMAFHGNKHEYKLGEDSLIHECSAINISQVDELVKVITCFSDNAKLFFTGGKFPGYNFNKAALEIIKKLNAKWWALNVNMINKVSPDNELYFNEQLNIIIMPTNISGDIFSKCFYSKPSGIKPFIKNIVRFIIGRENKNSDPIKYLNYLYYNRLPIIVQEHFQNQKTNGKRQTPNVYDDIWSLDLIYAFMKGKDIWYATCSELAHYYESFIHSSIKLVDETTFKLSYDGIYDKPFISIKLSASKLLHIESNKEFQGVLKNNSYWVFDNVEIGTYRIIN